jgi:hypothetical protein
VVKVAEYKRTCIACPSQWEGRLTDGRYFYVRFRWGHFGFGVGASEGDAVRNCEYVDEWDNEDEANLSGFMPDSTMKEFMTKHGFDMSEARLTTEPEEADL